MRRLSVTASIALSALFVLDGCTTTTAVAPQPATPAPLPSPPARPEPTPAPPVSADWRDWALTPGTWAYRQDARGSIALFGQAGSDAELTLRCDRAQSRIYLSRRGAGAASFNVRTTSVARRLDALPTGGTPAYLAAELGIRDSLLDAIGFSRGRFVVEAQGLPTLVVPAWAETLRVAEDCRGG
jgi:hypothetical protein